MGLRRTLEAVYSLTATLTMLSANTPDLTHLLPEIPSPALISLLSIKTIFKRHFSRQQGDSVSQGPAYEAWPPEFDPQDPHGGRRALAPESGYLCLPREPHVPCPGTCHHSRHREINVKLKSIHKYISPLRIHRIRKAEAFALSSLSPVSLCSFVLVKCALISKYL